MTNLHITKVNLHKVVFLSEVTTSAKFIKTYIQKLKENIK